MSEGGGVCSEAFSRIAVTAVKSGVGSRALGGKWGCSLCWGETSQFFYIGPTWEGPVLFLSQHPRARPLDCVGFRTKLGRVPTFVGSQGPPEFACQATIAWIGTPDILVNQSTHLAGPPRLAGLWTIDTYSGVTDDFGWILFENAQTGNYTITVYKDNWVTETQETTLEEDEDDTTTVLLTLVDDESSRV